MDPLKIFISSTCYDLLEVRSQLEEFCKSLGHQPKLSENGDILFDPDMHTHTSCIKAVESADFVVAIIDGRFGGHAIPEAISYATDGQKFIPEHYKNRSITQLEILYAYELGIPVFPFVSEAVWHDLNSYKKNKVRIEKIKELEKLEGYEKIKEIKDHEFTSISKPGTESLIFDFVEIIKTRHRDNSIFQFKSFRDIRETLKKQWSE